MTTLEKDGRATEPLVIGLGSEHRGDDRSGLEVVRALRDRVRGAARLVEGPADATALLDLWEGREWVIVVDAVRSGRPPGAVVRLEVAPGEVPGPLGATSTHGLSLADAVELSRSLGRLPARLTIFGIEAEELGVGDRMTPAVAAAVQEVCGRVLDELGPLSPPIGST